LKKKEHLYIGEGTSFMQTYEESINNLAIDPIDSIGLSHQHMMNIIDAMMNEEHPQQLNPAQLQQFKRWTNCLYYDDLSQLRNLASHQFYVSANHFNHLLIEQILEKYETISYQLSIIDDVELRQHLIQTYAPFIFLAKHILLIRPELNQHLLWQIAQHHNRFLFHNHLFCFQEWNKKMLKLFAEELYHDFEYRNAIASGISLHLLAVRKLLSPIKWLAALNSSLAILIRYIGYYFYKKIYDQSYIEVFRKLLRGYVFQSLYHILLTSFYVSILLYPFYLFPNLYLIVYANYAMEPLLEFCATPVNSWCRPIAEKLSISPILITLLHVGALIAASLLLYSSLTYTHILSMMNTLHILFKIFIPLAVVHQLNHILKIDPFIFFPCLALSGLISNIPILWNSLPINDFSQLLSNLVPQMVLLRFWYNQYTELNYCTSSINELKNWLPEAEERIPESTQISVLLLHKTANQSYRFFNTPKHADYIPTEQRSWVQTVKSVFGGI
jgi:hypothetical protein